MEDVRPYRNRNEESEPRRNDDDQRRDYDARTNERDEDGVPFSVPRD